MKIAEGMQTIEIKAVLDAGPMVIHPVVIRDADAVILVDAGMPRQLEEFKKAFFEAGIDIQALQAIILTHHDADHMGSASAIARTCSNKVEIFAHALEKPYIEGDAPPVQLIRLQRQLETAPEDAKARIRSMMAMYADIHGKIKIDVTRTISDGEALPFLGGITAIHTPGHTPGHVSLYHKGSKTLIAGDALVCAGDRLLPSPPENTLDMQAELASLGRLAKLDIQTVVCYHGGVYRGDARGRIAQLASITRENFKSIIGDVAGHG